ncbi:hypothetical protein Ciccas_005371 [Cichlidogyrus casuarinus]|uniref:UBA domain-containing protein n=1 Tax=Cichlidogyrus casuarinus TaxID=1844966 RepID=A0ABD2Q8U1_9PLAT
MVEQSFDEKVAMLMSMGFSDETTVKLALNAAKNDINEAINFLFEEKPLDYNDLITEGFIALFTGHVHVYYHFHWVLLAGTHLHLVTGIDLTTMHRFFKAGTFLILQYDMVELTILHITLPPWRPFQSLSVDRT